MGRSLWYHLTHSQNTMISKSNTLAIMSLDFPQHMDVWNVMIKVSPFMKKYTVEEMLENVPKYQSSYEV